jgi:hypothetical protein
MKVASNLFLSQWTKIQIMEKLCIFLLILVFPKDCNPNSECTPAKSFEFDDVFLTEVFNDSVWMESRVQFDFDFLCVLFQRLLSFGRLYKKLPFVIILLLNISHNCCVANSEVKKFLVFYCFFLFLNHNRVRCLNLLPQIGQRFHLLRTEMSSAQRTGPIASQDDIVFNAIVAEDMFARGELDGNIICCKTN